MKTKKSMRVPKKMQVKYQAIVALTNAVCADHLNDDYAEYARYLAAALARKRPSPIARGQAKSWAAGIIHALGLVNFLFDQSFEPAMRASEVWKAFGVSESTGGNKSRDIRNMFDMYQFDPNWTLPSMMEQNSFAWMVQTSDGFIMDARTLPLEIQQLLTEAGMIPERPDLFDAMETTQPKGNTAVSNPSAQCGLCGNTENLTLTSCCNQWICDDADSYQLFSYAHNSCYRNHDRYTLCASHWHEGHDGNWQSCEKCRQGFEIEMYVYFGTNEYNFEMLENPPKFEPTHCIKCNSVIRLSVDGFVQNAEGYICMRCSSPL